MKDVLRDLEIRIARELLFQVPAAAAVEQTNYDGSEVVPDDDGYYSHYLKGQREES